MARQARWVGLRWCKVRCGTLRLGLAGEVRCVEFCFGASGSGKMRFVEVRQARLVEFGHGLLWTGDVGCGRQVSACGG